MAREGGDTSFSVSDILNIVETRTAPINNNSEKRKTVSKAFSVRLLNSLMDWKRLHLNTEQSFRADVTPTAVPLVQADTPLGFLMCSKLSTSNF